MAAATEPPLVPGWRCDESWSELRGPGKQNESCFSGHLCNQRCQWMSILPEAGVMLHKDLLTAFWKDVHAHRDARMHSLEVPKDSGQSWAWMPCPWVREAKGRTV